MIGRRQMPTHRRPDDDGTRYAGCRCESQTVRIPHEVGTYDRTCRHCGRTFVATITVATWATAHCGGPVLHIQWKETS